jgi:hypothetical protein
VAMKGATTFSWSRRCRSCAARGDSFPVTAKRSDWRFSSRKACRTRRFCDEQRWIWETRVVPDDQAVEAMLVARLAGARCSGTPAIARRSKAWRTVRSGRGRPRRSGDQTEAKMCQRGARDCEKGEGAEDDPERVRGLPESGDVLGQMWRRSGYWIRAALRRRARVLGERAWRRRGVYMVGVAWQMG